VDLDGSESPVHGRCCLYSLRSLDAAWLNGLAKSSDRLKPLYTLGQNRTWKYANNAAAAGAGREGGEHNGEQRNADKRKRK